MFVYLQSMPDHQHDFWHRKKHSESPLSQKVFGIWQTLMLLCALVSFATQAIRIVSFPRGCCETTGDEGPCEC